MGNLLFKVRDFEIRKDSLYKILPKPDASAPDGLVNLGTTKIPSVRISNDVACRYKVTNAANQTGLYDTGLYEQSPCYANMDKDVVTEKVDLLNKHIVEPYERKYEEGALFHNNLGFWDNYKIRLSSGRIFSTNNIDDLLALYIALNSFELTPKDHVGNPSYKGSQYCIEDSTKVQTYKNEKAQLFVKATGQYTSLKDSNPTKLKNLLRYVGIIGFSSDIALDSLDAVVLEWLEKTEQNPIRFTEAYKLSSNKSTENIIYYYTMIGELTQKGVINRVDGIYIYNSINLGVDLKAAAKYLNGRSKAAQALALELTELHNKEKQ